MTTRKKRNASVDRTPATDTTVQTKLALLDELRAILRADLDVMLAAAHTARAAATHPEMRPENDKDTRGIEAGYLAAGQSARALEIQRALAELNGLTPSRTEVVAPLAIVDLVEEVNDASVSLVVFLAPHASGQRVAHPGVEVKLVSPASPMGQALLGKTVGDVVELRAAGRTRELEVVGVR